MVHFSLKKALFPFIDGEAADKATHVNVTGLTHNRDLRSFIGMLGYCSKDSGKPHFREIKLNVTKEDIVEGKEIHALEGRADLKHKICLTKANIFERTFVWWKYSGKGRALGSFFRGTIRQMLATGKFYFHSDWVSGRAEGMHEIRADAAWRILTAFPGTQAEMGDITSILFYQRPGNRDRYWNGQERYRRLEEEKNSRLLQEADDLQEEIYGVDTQMPGMDPPTVYRSIQDDDKMIRYGVQTVSNQ
jgi:hypothetical protein